MDGTFACPECGNSIEPVGLSPGREVRCDWCGSMVEVPYLPRAEQIKRMRHHRASRRSRRLAQSWAIAGAVLIGVLLTLAIADRFFRSQRRSAHSETFNQLLETSSQAEKSRRFDEALVALESALSLADAGECPGVDIEDLRRRRDRLAWLEAEAQLKAMESSTDDPGRAVGRSLTLRMRVAREPALAGLGERVELVLERLQLRRVDGEAALSHAAEEANRFTEAVDLAARVHDHASELAANLRVPRQADARALAARVIGRAGAVVEPVRGHYTLGAPKDYDAVLLPLLATGLRNAGYLTRNHATNWGDLWATVAPYHLGCDVSESDAGVYLSSPNRLSRIDLRITLSRHGRPIWSGDPSGVTSVPVPGISAYQASRAAVSNGRSVEFERLLYDNARANLFDRLGTFLRNLPPLTSSAAAATAGS
jgi:hypothetical protein